MTPLVQLDPSAMTADQAKLHFQDYVRKVQEQHSLGLTAAWALVRGMYPALASKAFSGGAPTEPPKVESVGRYGDSSAVIKPLAPLPYAGRGGMAPSLALKLMPNRPVSIPNEGNIEALGLPRDVEFDEFRAADLANAGAFPRNSAAILEALIGLQAQSGTSPEAARDAARVSYPQLFSEVNRGGGAGANSNEQEASRKAHLASSLAEGKPGHLTAAAAHQAAADAQSRAGDTEAAKMHRRMASYHTSQADQSKKS